MRSKKSWKIVSSSGVELGTYPGATKRAALDAMARDAGYRSQLDAVRNGIAPFSGDVVESVSTPRGDARRGRGFTHYTGPTNDNYGYDRDLCAPAPGVIAAARLKGKKMWNALERLDWVSCESVDPDWDPYEKSRLIGSTSSVDGESLELSP
jgi:hypothetical protein